MDAILLVMADALFTVDVIEAVVVVVVVARSVELLVWVEVLN